MVLVGNWLTYSSTYRTQDPTKAQKDLVQAVTLAAILIEQDSVSLRESFAGAPCGSCA